MMISFLKNPILQTCEKIESQFSRGDFSFILLRMDEADDQLDFNFAADDLLELPRDLGEVGYFEFSSERRQAIRALAEKFGIALNQRVRLRLRGWNEELEGKLMLDSLLVPALDEKIIRLRLGSVSFDHTDIELCQTLD